MKDREIQLFLVAFIIVEICEIFTVGGLPLQYNVVAVRGNLALPHLLELMVSGFHRGSSCSDRSDNMDPPPQQRRRLPVA